MAVYSISDLERLSGVKAHTIRVWEQRYALLQPKRTSTNIRYYDDSDLRYLLNVALLNNKGFRISKIAKMSSEEMQTRILEVAEGHSEDNTHIRALTIATMEMDEYRFDRIIRSRMMQLGFERMMTEIVYPFLDRISLLWQSGSVNPAQWSFITNLIRQKMIVAIDNATLVQGNHAHKFLVYLPEGERQELSLLFVHYLLKSRRHQVIYLGQNISLSEVRSAVEIHKPGFIYTMLGDTFDTASAQRYTTRLTELFPDVTVLLSGPRVSNTALASQKRIRIVNSLDATISFLDSQLMEMKRA